MPVIHNHPFPPPIVEVDHSDRLVSINTLNKAQKQQLWTGIKGDNPDLAKLLKDPDFKALQDKFEARVQFPIQELNRYMEAGQTK